MNVLREDYPKAVMLNFGCQMKRHRSEDAFFRYCWLRRVILGH
jgi:hypothetical protein